MEKVGIRNLVLMYVLLMVVASDCSHDVQGASKDTLVMDNNEPKPVIIWIHGTRTSYHFPLNLISSLADLDSHINPPFMGLHSIKDCPVDNHIVTIAKTLYDADPVLFPMDNFYTFGWSGKLSHQERLAASKQLRDEIEQQIIKQGLETFGKVPQITIITHSHGGNVALNMARGLKGKVPFVIDKLILLACPVQALTHKYIESPLFNRVYSLFSHNDVMQVLDPQLFPSVHKSIVSAYRKRSFHPIKKLWSKEKHLCFFSRRKFADRHKLTQIEVSWDKSRPCNDNDLSIYGKLKSVASVMNAFDFFKKRGLTHIEFLIPSFLSQLSTIINHPFVIKEFCSFGL